MRCLLLCATGPSALLADVRLPALFGDHMALQRERPIHAWGKGTPVERVSAPMQARYAWAADPDGNLVNGAELPASPFRTMP